MYAGYAELEQLPPEAYLEWQNFGTPWDSMPVNVARQQERYEEGLKVGRFAEVFHITCRGTWGTTNKPDGLSARSHTSSYEGIGYHANTAHFLHGVLDSGVPIVVHRWDSWASDGTRIK